MWVWPQLVFGGSPTIPHSNWRTLPSSQSPPFPPPPSLSLFPPHPFPLFAILRDEAAHAGGAGRVLRRRGGGWRGRALQRYLGPDPHLGHSNLDGQNRQSPIASDFGSQTQIAALFAILLHPNVENKSPIARFESQFRIARTLAIRIARF